jgi:hypothetical protein
MTRRRWQQVVLSTALLLVVAQVIAFLIIRGSRDSDDRTAKNDLAVEPASKPVTEPVERFTAVFVDAAPAVVPPAVVPPAVVPPAVVPPAVVPPDATPEVDRTGIEVERPAPEVVPPAPAIKPVDKRPRVDVVAQQLRERRERERKAAEEQQRNEEERKRVEAERKRIEVEREKAEQARIAADLEKQRLAAERAKAEAETAKLAAERARQAEVAKAAPTQKPGGSPSVLVLVLGPGVPSVGSEQIRNVYLGRTSVWPNGTAARPMNRSFGTAAARKFFAGVLGMSGGTFLEHWSEIQLGGGGIAPPTISSATSLIAKVASTQGGFGYVLESELPENTSGVRLVRLD